MKIIISNERLIIEYIIINSHMIRTNNVLGRLLVHDPIAISFYTNRHCMFVNKNKHHTNSLIKHLHFNRSMNKSTYVTPFIRTCTRDYNTNNDDERWYHDKISDKWYYVSDINKLNTEIRSNSVQANMPKLNYLLIKNLICKSIFKLKTTLLSNKLLKYISSIDLSKYINIFNIDVTVSGLLCFTSITYFIWDIVEQGNYEFFMQEYGIPLPVSLLMMILPSIVMGFGMTILILSLPITMPLYCAGIVIRNIKKKLINTSS